MKRFLAPAVLAALLLLPAASFAVVANINTCEVRGVVVDVHTICADPGGCFPYAVAIFDEVNGSMSFLQVGCFYSPPRMVGGVPVFYCDVVRAGDCIHAKGRSEFGACEARTLFAVLSPAYCP